MTKKDLVALDTKLFVIRRIVVDLNSAGIPWEHGLSLVIEILASISRKDTKS